MAKRFDPNNVMVGGRMSKKPELKYTPNQKAVTTVSLANNQGEYNGQDVVYWVDVVIWGSQAERLCENLDKGSYIVVEGRLQTRQYDEQDTGKKRTVTEVHAKNVYWMDNVGAGSSTNAARNTDNTQTTNNNYGQSSSSNTQSPTPAHDAPGGGVQLDISDDDIPF